MGPNTIATKFRFETSKREKDRYIDGKTDRQLLGYNTPVINILSNPFLRLLSGLYLGDNAHQAFHSVNDDGRQQQQLAFEGGATPLGERLAVGPHLSWNGSLRRDAFQNLAQIATSNGVMKQARSDNDASEVVILGHFVCARACVCVCVCVFVCEREFLRVSGIDSWSPDHVG